MSLSPLVVGVRALQAASGLIAMIFVSLGYIEFTSGQLSSGAAIFSYVANYSAILCGTYYVVALHFMKWSKREPKIAFQRIIDGALVAGLVLAGILHTSSDAVKNCESHNMMFSTFHGSGLFRCGNMSFGVLMTFVTGGLCLVTFVHSFIRASPDATTNLANEEEPSAARQYAAMGTPVIKAHEIEEPVQHSAVRKARVGARGVQFLCSAIALTCMALGYRHYYTGQYLSPKATYAILITYTCMIYSLWHVVAVEKFQLSRRPKIHVERIVDVTLAVLLLVAGVIFTMSTHVKDCSALNDKFEKNHGDTLYRCGGLSAGVAFLFFAVLTYGTSVVLSYKNGGDVENRDSVMTVDSHNGDASIQA